MPEGVLEMLYMARAVSADEKSAAIGRKAAARHRPKYFSAGISGSPKPTKNDRQRARLLDAVRRGDPEAIRELREQHHAWIIPREGVVGQDGATRDEARRGAGNGPPVVTREET
jgi:hypothetical protein